MMAATRLIPLHVNKGKTVAQCLADRTDYSENAEKTNDGEFISSYECDAKTADEEFLLSKRQYQHITGRQQKDDIIAYQLRQSFKPGEITPGEANQVGYELAMRFTKGKHAFIVATHIDRAHIHNHIIYNSTALDCTRKFKNFFLSSFAIQRLSDCICVEHGLSIITPSDPKLVDMLRKKSEIGKTSISKRQIVSVSKMKEAKEFLRDYFDVMDVPDDEDGLIAFIVKKFSEQKTHYEALDALYTGHKYPDHSLVSQALTLMDDVLSQQKDNIALVDRVIKKQDAIYDNKEAMQNVEGFFKNQVAVYDAAVQLEADLHNELDYLSKEPEANTALNQIRLITNATGKFEYKKIPDLNGLMTTVHEGHDRLLAAKRDELLEIVRQCMEAIHTTAHLDTDRNIVAVADTFYTQKKERIAELMSLALLDGLLPQMLTYKDDTVEKLETMHKPAPQPSVVNDPGTAYGGGQPQPKKVIKALNRSVVFPAKKLESDADIDAYVEKMRDQLKQLMKNCDGIQLK